MFDSIIIQYPQVVRGEKLRMSEKTLLYSGEKLSMDIKILRTNLPLIDGFPWHGAVFSIINPEEDKYLPWIFNNHIQLRANQGIDFYLSGFYCEPNYCPFIEITTIQRNQRVDIIKLITTAISNENYIYMMVKSQVFIHIKSRMVQYYR